MNTQDVKLENQTGDRLQLVFEHQAELKVKYDEIEKKNGFQVIPDIPIPIDIPLAQLRVKEFLWRVTEELGEATDSMEHMRDFNEHFKEEIADALHFLTELTIMLGIPKEELIIEFRDLCNPPYTAVIMESVREEAKNGIDGLKELFILCPPGNNGYPIDVFMWKITEDLAMVGNTLKQKPWKSTHMATDVQILHKRVIEVWRSFIAMCRYCAGMDHEELFDLYMRKNTVNHFRIRSRY